MFQGALNENREKWIIKRTTGKKKRHKVLFVLIFTLLAHGT